MNKLIESFIVYFYDGDTLTDDGVDLFPICGDYLIEETDGASMVCFDVENDAVKKLEGKICKTIIKTMDGNTYVFDKSKISIFQIKYTLSTYAEGLVEKYGGLPHFRITKI